MLVGGGAGGIMLFGLLRRFLVGRLGVALLHLRQFLVGDFRQLPDEHHEPPLILFSMVAIETTTTPSRHAGEADAILDDREQLAIGEGLRPRLPQARQLWIAPRPDR